MLSAMTFFVNPNTGNHSNDGRSEKTAFRNLSHALDAAAAGDKILVTPATYDEDLPKLIARAKAAGITVAVLGGH
ncbi:DUF1565 domain-containing protein [Methyloceanibacter sp.]|jgi:hypothetical protein|uniref:DUF1565 domain-containing protein n=1 Tax=Methyloceanibacter sp. TaxID=1965321 RepID=UPI0035680ECB